MKRTCIYIAICTSLIGCGSGNHEGNDTDIFNSKLSGKAIDGYVVGATVFLDVNFSGRLDANEPYTITTEGGDYTLALTGEFVGCGKYAPVVTYVPVGAIDEDFGEVTEAYVMTTPPTFKPVSEDDFLHITPLTSLVWDSIKQDYTLLQGKTCQELKQNQATYTAMQEDMVKQERRIASQYNITVNDIYIDYISEGNTELQAYAEGIVKQLQASYAHQAVLKYEYPDAMFHVVTINSKLFNDEEVFYRQSEVLWTENYLGKNDLLNPNNLNEVIRNVGYTTRTTEEIAGMNFYQGLSWNSAPDGSYTACSRTESINDEPTHMSSSSTLEINNQISIKGAQTAEACKNIKFTIEDSNRSIYMHDRSSGDYEEASSWSYNKNGYLFDDGLFMNMANRVGSEITISDFGILPFELSPGPYMNSYGAVSYNSFIREGNDDKDHTETYRYSDGFKEIRSVSENGTWSITCSNSEGETASNEEDCNSLPR